MNAIHFASRNRPPLTLDLCVIGRFRTLLTQFVLLIVLIGLPLSSAQAVLVDGTIGGGEYSDFMTFHLVDGNGDIVNQGNPAVLYWSVDPNDSNCVYAAFVTPLSLNDNSYGTGALGWTSGHTLKELVTSDKGEFTFTDANGDTVLNFEMDYAARDGLSIVSAGPGGGGLSQDDGSGATAGIVEWSTSLEHNLLGVDFAGNINSLDTVDSPTAEVYLFDDPLTLLVDEGLLPVAFAPSMIGNIDYSKGYTNSTDPDWIYEMIYEVKVDFSQFANTGGFGGVSFDLSHNSPSKVGVANAYPSIPEPSTWLPLLALIAFVLIHEHRSFCRKSSTAA